MPWISFLLGVSARCDTHRADERHPKRFFLHSHFLNFVSTFTRSTDSFYQDLYKRQEARREVLSISSFMMFSFESHRASMLIQHDCDDNLTTHYAFIHSFHFVPLVTRLQERLDKCAFTYISKSKNQYKLHWLNICREYVQFDFCRSLLKREKWIWNEKRKICCQLM